MPLSVTCFIHVFCIVLLFINSFMTVLSLFLLVVGSPSIHPVLELTPVLRQISIHVIFKTFTAESNSRSQVLLHLSQGFQWVALALNSNLFLVYNNFKQHNRKRAFQDGNLS